ncbi:MAG: U32 family peptidase [Clostridiaceae bacterium]|nr:U32 family peptidase [Clostridiaceae bacterium]
MDKIELLAPAGDWEAFLAAVENGANAVYLGGRLFNARQFASNFDMDRLKEAIHYAHARGVSLYLTMNTLMSDEELLGGVQFLREVYLAGIDGVIVQDLGFARVVKSLFPDLPIHASTQMTIYNLEGVRLLQEMGFERVVLARELSLEEIKNITARTNTEIEVFIHGALCISYSGQCLMSSIIGGRSGNRGKCAQPCRLPFELVESGSGKAVSTNKGAYIMSPKDLCSVQILNKLLEAGVKSLKIEGRMKGPEYVATVTKTYRKYLDINLAKDASITLGKYNVEDKDMKELTQVFNRGGFSKGYLEGKTGSTMMSYEKPKNWGVFLGKVISYDRSSLALKLLLKDEVSMGDGIEVWNGEEKSPGTVISRLEVKGAKVESAKAGEVVLIRNIKGNIVKDNKVYKTSDKKLNNLALESASGKFYRKVPVYGELHINKNEPITLTVKDDVGNSMTVTGSLIAQEAINKSLTEERVLAQITKTGQTPFEFANISVFIDEMLSIPISEINKVRRSALEQLELKRATRYLRKLLDNFDEKQNCMMYFPGNDHNNDKKLLISAYLYKFNDKIDYGNLAIDRLYIPFASLLNKNAREILSSFKGKEIYLYLPSITRGNYDKLMEERLSEFIDIGIDGLLVGNIGHLDRDKYPSKLNIMGDYSLNCFNSSSLKQLAQLGLSGATLSFELTLNQIRNLISIPGFTKEALVYGRIPLMTSEYCPVGSIAGRFDSKTKCSVACEKGEYYLKDRIGTRFPVLCDRLDCRSTVYNSNVLLLEENIGKIKDAGVDIIRLNFTDETGDEIKDIVNMHRDLVAFGKRALDSHRKLIDRIKNSGFTKGHYFRGV